MIDDAYSLWELMERRADVTPDKVMLYDDGREVTFSQYRDWSERVAAGLTEAYGVGEGTAVSWQLPTWSESAVLLGALSRLGAVQNPMLPLYRDREVRFITEQTGCELLVVPTEFRGFGHAALARAVANDRPGMEVLVCDRSLPEGDPGSLAAPATAPDPAGDPVRWIFYTSGTTADPKGAQHTDRTIMATSIRYCRRVQASESDSSLVAFPFTHAGGIIIGIFQALLTGAGSVLIETFTPQAATELVARHGITFGNGAPAIHQMLLEEARANPDAYKSIRAFPSGGASKPPQLHEALKEVVPGNAGIISGYGLTECPILSQTAIDDPDESRRDGEGRPQDGVEIKFLDLDGKEVDGEGELAVKGPMLMRGYLDSTLDAGAFTSDGFFKTGDLARLDRNGAIIITGRIKDIIIRKGENISAKELEDVLFAHPAVADVAVIGLPDPDAGEIACAVLVIAEGSEPLSRDDVFRHCTAAGLMKQKIPERVEVVAELPRNPTGKVLKHELKAQFST